MITHGKPTDGMLYSLCDELSPGDTILDFANEHYKTSVHRHAVCCDYDINYLGIGISGGTKGALEGPSVMVGGTSFKNHDDFLNSFCKNVVHVDEDPDSGHFTKMVHNGIEYAMMQAIADIYAFTLNDRACMTQIIHELRTSIISGSLLNITMEALKRHDLNSIRDVAHMNDTGLWCVQYALENRLSVPTIEAAVNTRISSQHRSNSTYKKHDKRYQPEFRMKLVRESLFFMYAMASLDGIKLLKHKGIDISRAQTAYNTATIIECPLISFDEKTLLEVCDRYANSARKLAFKCIIQKIPVPLLVSCVQYYDFMKSEKTSVNLIMAQRNVFGGHSLT
jgi:6-phosphogluconate dehydrogenase